MKPSALLPSDRPDVCLLAPPAANVAHGIVSQAVLTAPGLRVTLFRFAAGQELSEHTSTARVLVQVLSGACDFWPPDIPTPCARGNCSTCPPA
jgi:hypothetical protein